MAFGRQSLHDLDDVNLRHLARGFEPMPSVLILHMLCCARWDTEGFFFLYPFHRPTLFIFFSCLWGHKPAASRAVEIFQSSTLGKCDIGESFHVT